MGNLNVIRFEAYPHFSLHEFECPCCRLVMLEPELLQHLEATRAELSIVTGQDTPLLIPSGYRCKAHNARIGGRINSFHVHGMAADVSSRGVAKVVIARAANRAGVPRVGLYRKQVRRAGRLLTIPVLHLDIADPVAIETRRLFGNAWPEGTGSGG